MVIFPGALRKWLIMRRSLRYGTLIFREFRRTKGWHGVFPGVLREWLIRRRSLR